MRILVLAAGWAVAMLILALLARIGLVEPDTAGLLLLMMPMIAFATLQSSSACVRTAGGS